MPTTRATGQPAPFILPVSPSDARRELKTLLTGSRWCRHIDAVVLAVHEALTNADRHGGGVAAVHAFVDRGSLVIEICDRGEGFDVGTAMEVDAAAAVEDPLTEHGRVATRVLGDLPPDLL